MGLYNFQPRFEQPIMSGRKTHTIRRRRKHPDVPGNTLYLYVGLRHSGARRILAPRCTRVQDISIERSVRFHAGVYLFWPKITVSGILLADDEVETLAWRDGFENAAELVSFWDGEPLIDGDIIHWQPSLDGAR